MELDQFLESDIMTYLDTKIDSKERAVLDREEEYGLYVTRDYLKELEVALDKDELTKAKKIFDDLKDTYLKLPKNSLERKKIYSLLEEMYAKIEIYLNMKEEEHRMLSPAASQVMLSPDYNETVVERGSRISASISPFSSKSSSSSISPNVVIERMMPAEQNAQPAMQQSLVFSGEHSGDKSSKNFESDKKKLEKQALSVAKKSLDNMKKGKAETPVVFVFNQSTPEKKEDTAVDMLKKSVEKPVEKKDSVIDENNEGLPYLDEMSDNKEDISLENALGPNKNSSLPELPEPKKEEPKPLNQISQSPWTLPQSEENKEPEEPVSFLNLEQSKQSSKPSSKQPEETSKVDKKESYSKDKPSASMAENIAFPKKGPEVSTPKYPSRDYPAKDSIKQESQSFQEQKISTDKQSSFEIPEKFDEPDAEPEKYIVPKQPVENSKNAKLPNLMMIESKSLDLDKSSSPSKYLKMVKKFKKSDINGMNPESHHDYSNISQKSLPEMYEAGLYCMYQNNYADAIKIFEKIVELRPKNRAARIRLQQCHEVMENA
jgi:hypothetical protein